MKLKRILIIVFFIFSLMPINAYAESKQYNNYLTLGDSIAAGYALKNVENGYSYIVKDALKIADENFDNLAIPGTTAKQFNEMIRTREYTEKIKSADLITISIGANEILKIIKSNFLEISGVTLEQTRDLDEFNKVMTQKVSVKDKEGLKNLYSMITTLYERLTSKEIDSQLVEQINQYKISWKASIDYINEINPNVTIIVTEFYNPFYNFILLYDWGEFANKYIDEFNKYQYEISNNETNYKIVKIHDLFNADSPRITNVSTNFSAFSIDPHPNKEGHRIIANEITKILGIEGVGGLEEKVDNQEIKENEIKKQNSDQSQNYFIILIIAIVCVITLILIGIILIIKKKK